MSKRVKQMVVSEISDRLAGATEMLVVDSSRLDAVTDNEWRRSLRKLDIQVLTVKNSLARKSLRDAGVDQLDSVLAGPSTLVWGSEDIVSLSKEIAKWAKQLEPLEIKGGTVEGETLSASDVEALSKSPSRQELIGQIVGLMLSPGAQLVAAMLGPGATLAGQLETIAEGEEKAE